jgi:protein-S-isoprenylcysteine O-methyltransferase Ste14
MSGPDSPRIFVPPPLIFVSALVLGLAIDGRFADPTAAPPSVLLAAAGLLMFAGLALILAGLLTFFWKGARAEPWRGTDVFVAVGIYRLTRNPMYLGLALAYAGLALLFRSPVAGLLLIPLLLLMDRLVIPREEAYLARRFGADYEAYRRRVRRWL